MMIASIDIQNGRAVQLVNGKTFALDGGDPLALAERFSLFGEIAVVDLDAALGKGSNEELVLQLVGRYDCRVGGGIRDIEKARRLLDAGASRIMIGSRAEPDFLSQLPRDRLIASLDAFNGSVMTEGWTKAEAVGLEDKIRQLAPLVSGFLCTQIEREGTMSGVDLEYVNAIKAILTQVGYSGDFIFAGGVRRAEEVAALDALGVDAQVGMALYTGAFSQSDALIACLKSDRPDGLYPTVVADEYGRALGLVYSSPDSLRAACEQRKGIYYSRTRGLWEKGLSSGASQELLSVYADCDRDALQFTVKQHGAGFCHRQSFSCFGEGRSAELAGLPALERVVQQRQAELMAENIDKQSYTRRLYLEPGLLNAKLVEEAAELAEAETAQRAAEEAADLLYFLFVKLAKAGATLKDVQQILERRSRKLSRRPGNAKRPYEGKGNQQWQNGLH